MTHTRNHYVVVLLGLAAVLHGSPARAEAPILLYGPDGPDEALEARAQVAYNLQNEGRRSIPRIRHISTALTGIPAVDAVGTVTFQLCSASPVSPQTLVEEMGAAREMMDWGETAEATKLLDRLAESLPCLTGVLEREQLTQIYYLRGVALTHAGRTDEARESFRQALVMKPVLRAGDDAGPTMKTVFDEALREAFSAVSQDQNTDIRAGVGDAAQLHIDGEPRGAGKINLAQGHHLVQWQILNGEFVTRMVVMGPEATLTILSSFDVADAAVSGEGSAVALELAAQELHRLAGESGVDAVYLAQLGDVDLLHRFEVATREWAITDHGAVATKLKRRKLATAGGVALVGGSLAVVAGTVMGIAGYTQADKLQSDENLSNIDDADEAADAEAAYYRNRNLAYVGYVTAGAGGAALAIGIPLTIAGKRQPSGSARRDAPLAPVLSIAPMGVALTGSF